MTPEFQRDPHLIDAILPTLGAIRSIVEIGCHRMEDTLFLRKMFPGAQIFAFDPDPRNTRFIRDHRLAVRHDVTFFEMAVADEDCVRPFYLSTNRAASERDEWTRSSSLRPPCKPQDEALLRQGAIPYVVAEKPIQVTCRRLDMFKLQPNFIWCDAQGAEDMIISGATETLKRTRWMLIEHNTNGCYEGAPNRAALEALLPGWVTRHVWPYDMLLENPNT